MASPLPDRPKGMWQRTYERLHKRTFETEMRAEEAMDFRLLALAGGIDLSQRKRTFWT
jgi:hypothetical protein